MQKPRLSFWQIWNMSFGFLGIQFGWGLQMANMSSIYQFLGAREDELSLLWIAAPITGLIVQPIVGHMSDRTWNKLGRRRPYFLVGAVLASVALVAMPRSSALWMAVGLLWILDASGIMGAASSGEEESFEQGLLEYPHYTRPVTWEGRTIPEVLRSGDHAKIAAWRLERSREDTRLRRPDLIERHGGASQAPPSGARRRDKKADER